MIRYGVRAVAPGSSRALRAWVVKDHRRDGTFDVAVLRALAGADGRGRLGLAVMRSLVDAAASRVATKYERVLNTIHDTLERQQMREDILAEVRAAVVAIPGPDGADLVDRHWDQVCAALDAAHPLNPRVADAESAIEHLGGMQLHMTTARHKRRFGSEHGPGDVDEAEAAARALAATGRNHDLPEDQLLAQFGAVVGLITACIAEPDTEHAVYTCELPGGGSDTLVGCDPVDYGVANTPDGARFAVGAGTGHMYFYTPPAGPAFTSATNAGGGTLARVLPGGVQQPVRGARVEVLRGVHPSVCVSRLVHPCVAAAAAQSGVYDSAVRKVAGMMAHVNGFTAQTNATTAAVGRATQGALDRARGTFAFGEEGLVVMTPAGQRDGGGEDTRCDFSIDFDVEGAWSIGLSPTVDTDAAEAAQVVLGRIA